MSAPLEGIKVLDFSTLLPGPMASLILIEAGAEVIKIERPSGGDDMRAYPPAWGDDGAHFSLLNRGKKSLAIDLKLPAAQAQLRPLLERADIVLEQFRPGVMDRLGFGYADLIKIKPDLIYCAITGYGQTGARKQRAGHDLNYMGDSGLLALSMGDEKRPTVPPALVADIAAGAYPAVMNILLALRHRDRTGEGAFLDISMTDNLSPFMFSALAIGQATGHWSGNGEGLLTGGSPRYQLYPTNDGKVAAVAALEPKFWTAFCETIGLHPSLRNDSIDPEATKNAVADILAKMPADHWQQLFDQADCCCTIVQTLEQAISCAKAGASEPFEAKLEGPDGREMPALPLPIAKVFRTSDDRSNRAPGLGADNDELL